MCAQFRVGLNMYTNMVNQSQLTSQCQPVQVLGRCHCTDYEFLDTKDCSGNRTRRRTGKNAANWLYSVRLSYL